MLLSEIEEYFGTFYQAGKSTGIACALFYYCQKEGHVPLTVQLRIEDYTEGKLVADPKHGGNRCGYVYDAMCRHVSRKKGK